MNVRNNIIILVMTLIAVVSVILSLPHDTETFSYEYKEGQPWKYEQVIAQYAFPIMKSNKQLAHEQDSALRQVAPYCQYDQTTEATQLERFAEAVHNMGALGIRSAQLNHVRSLLHDVYDKGIMDNKEYAAVHSSATKVVRILDGPIATTRDVANILTPRKAYEHIAAECAPEDHSFLVLIHIEDFLAPNILYDKEKTEIARNDARENVSPSSGMVQAGERIIDRGELVTQQKYDILESLKRENLAKKEKDIRSLIPVVIGQSGIVIFFFGLIFVFLHLFRPYIRQSVGSIIFLYSIITLFTVVSCLFVKFQFFSVYMIPFAMVPVFVRVFLDSRTAIMAHVTLIILTSIPLHTNYHFIVTEIAAGIVAVYSVRELTQRSQLIHSAFLITATMLFVGLFLDLIGGANLYTIDRSWYYYTMVSGVALLFGYPLMYLIERIFGFTSSVTLIELTNINAPIFRRMSKEAQGTFVHSMQVANLAAEVADKIGAKVQLVRTGAMYHDIGKLANPAFFTENQNSVNPHDALEEERSASIIINHVADGLKVAEKYNVPKVIRDFILTHHGQSLVKYFYIQACNKHGEENVDKSLFTYPGKNPFTREQAILMMADGVEAASRSLKEYSEESIARLVDNIIDNQVLSGFYKECPITFRDISVAKRVFADSLKTIYHTRIAYPEAGQKTNSNTPAATTAPAPEAEPEQRPRLFSSNNWKWR